ncbi:GM10951 [Drosophila sechellia]|uniref:GM10951 n=1 Tax=Drosophila sechellia TaxID=7238 RepID=B4I4S7_DROSE|nr:GM10951 [Drosophila sechellia]
MDTLSLETKLDSIDEQQQSSIYVLVSYSREDSEDETAMTASDLRIIIPARKGGLSAEVPGPKMSIISQKEELHCLLAACPGTSCL